jgi:outer membrane protein W
MNKFIAAGALLFLCMASAHAGVEGSQPVVAQTLPANPFASGAKEFQSAIGPFFFADKNPNTRPAIDFVFESLRFGVMLSNPHGSNFLAGNVELLGEVFAGPVVTGPGNVATGLTLILRYNFVQPHARVLPYVQIGAGGVYTDIPEKESGGLISLPVEFNLQGIIGSRIMLNERWSFLLEAAYRHISNAEIKKPNFGIDSVGGNVGFGFFF